MFFLEKRKLEEKTGIQSGKRRKIRSEPCNVYEDADICVNDDRNDSEKRSNDIKKTDDSNKNDDSASKQEQNQIVKTPFQIDDVVWVKIRGSPSWPARIAKFYYGRTVMVDIICFNDY